MNTVKQTIKTDRQFSDLYQGDMFMYDGDIYMKTGAITGESVSHNALKLETGALYNFTGSTNMLRVFSVEIARKS